MLISNSTTLSIRNLVSSGFGGTLKKYNLTALAWLLAAALPFLYVVVPVKTTILSTFLLSLVVVQFWHFVFTQPTFSNVVPGPYAILHAILFSLLLPLSVSTWMLILCVSFGCVFGERVFGGRGYSFLHPVTVGVVFYLYSLNIDPTTTAASHAPLWLTLSMVVLLLILELVSWRTLVGLGVGLLPSFWLVELNELTILLTHSSTLFVLLFLGCDPGSGASTNPSRWMHGVLLGLLLALLYSQNTQIMLATVSAVLLASLSAPLLDHVVVQVHTARRRRRYE